VTAIAAGTWHSLALKKDGSVVAWGCGFFSLFGFSTDWGQCTVPAAAASGVRALAAGQSHSLALLKASQTITFGALANKTFGDPDFAVSASASSGLPVSFRASGNCTITAAIVHITGAGLCTITASQPGDANYNAAPDVAPTFAIARAPCRVPNLVGKRLAAAKLTIAKRHCRVGKVGYAYSRKGKKGTVISLNPRPGRVLPADSKIDLVVSRGRRVNRGRG
jgi:hypothetical protein